MAQPPRGTEPPPDPAAPVQPEARGSLFASAPSQRQRNRIQKVLDFIDAFNTRNVDGLRSYFAERHIDRTFFGHQSIDREAKIRMFLGFLDAFPDWVETLDEIVPGDNNNDIIVRHTGRGTQTKPFMGRTPTGRQMAADAIDIVTFDDEDRVVEYKTTFPFTAFFDETITADEHLMETRAEQGGTLINSATRRQITEAWRDGAASFRQTLQVARAAQPITRCQALLESNLRRCQNEAAEGSIYCNLHSRAGFGPPPPNG